MYLNYVHLGYMKRQKKNIPTEWKFLLASVNMIHVLRKWYPPLPDVTWLYVLNRYEISQTELDLFSWALLLLIYVYEKLGSVIPLTELKIDSEKAELTVLSSMNSLMDLEVCRTVTVFILPFTTSLSTCQAERPTKLRAQSPCGAVMKSYTTCT